MKYSKKNIKIDLYKKDSSMKKLLVLLFSMLVSVCSYGETYACSYTCYGSDTKTCLSSFKRVNSSFFIEPSSIFGDITFNVVENEDFLSMASLSINDFGANVLTVVIDKGSLHFIRSITSVYSDPPSTSDSEYKKGLCIVMD